MLLPVMMLDWWIQTLWDHKTKFVTASFQWLHHRHSTTFCYNFEHNHKDFTTISSTKAASTAKCYVYQPTVKLVILYHFWDYQHHIM